MKTRFQTGSSQDARPRYGRYGTCIEPAPSKTRRNNQMLHCTRKLGAGC
jgi:hypothetical protein